MRRDRRRLPFRALERRHIGRPYLVRVRRDVVVGDLKLAHGTPPIISASPWHTEPAFSRPCNRGCERRGSRQHEALVTARRDIRAELPIAHHAAGVGHENTGLAGDVGAQVPGMLG